MNFFNSLPLRLQLRELGKCSLLDASEFHGVERLKGKRIVIAGCGAQGLNQGLNLRDSGLDVAYALREQAILDRRNSWRSATESGFTVDTFANLVPTADLVINLTPDKQHTDVVNRLLPLMKRGACLSYSHGFNIVEEGMKIREDLTVIMVAPKAPGTELREEYKRGFGVPTLIAVHTDNDPQGDGLEIAKAYAVGTGGHRAGVLLSSFVAEVKSDLMGEQTILCGLLQTGSVLCYDKMVEGGIEPGYASRLVQQGWETVTEALKVGGITNMMDRLGNPAKIRAFALAEELKEIMRPLFESHMDRILTGEFSAEMMEDWKNDDANLLQWREETNALAFERSIPTKAEMEEQEFFDSGILMVAIVKAGVELAFETMTAAGIKEESAYYESLHEVPLIANLIARKKLYEMNRVISDTAEYGCYLFSQKCVPLLAGFMKKIDTDVIGEGLKGGGNGVDNVRLDTVNRRMRSHAVENIGSILREYMNKSRS